MLTMDVCDSEDPSGALRNILKHCHNITISNYRETYS